MKRNPRHRADSRYDQCFCSYFSSELEPAQPLTSSDPRLQPATAKEQSTTASSGATTTAHNCTADFSIGLGRSTVKPPLFFEACSIAARCQSRTCDSP